MHFGICSAIEGLSGQIEGCFRRAPLKEESEQAWYAECDVIGQTANKKHQRTSFFSTVNTYLLTINTKSTIFKLSLFLLFVIKLALTCLSPDWSKCKTRHMMFKLKFVLRQSGLSRQTGQTLFMLNHFSTFFDWHQGAPSTWVSNGVLNCPPSSYYLFIYLYSFGVLCACLVGTNVNIWYDNICFAVSEWIMQRAELRIGAHGCFHRRVRNDCSRRAFTSPFMAFVLFFCFCFFGRAGGVSHCSH